MRSDKGEVLCKRSGKDMPVQETFIWIVYIWPQWYLCGFSLAKLPCVTYSEKIAAILSWLWMRSACNKTLLAKLLYDGIAFMTYLWWAEEEEMKQEKLVSNQQCLEGKLFINLLIYVHTYLYPALLRPSGASRRLPTTWKNVNIHIFWKHFLLLWKLNNSKWNRQK